MTECVFCKIIKNEIPCDKIYENDKVLAFLDISPVNFGHALIVPKKHSETILDINEKDFCEVMKTAKKISIALMKALKSDGINVSINNKKAAGQLVPHLHTHVIPRFEKDGLKYDWPTKQYPVGEVNKIIEKIKKQL